MIRVVLIQGRRIRNEDSQGIAGPPSCPARLLALNSGCQASIALKADRKTYEIRQTEREPKHDHGIQDANVYTQFQCISSDYSKQVSGERFMLNAPAVLEVWTKTYGYIKKKEHRNLLRIACYNVS